MYIAISSCNIGLGCPYICMYVRCILQHIYRDKMWSDLGNVLKSDGVGTCWASSFCILLNYTYIQYPKNESM
jgi:hypothetical protein